jgi:predicted MFS family arabinose efflux permease
MSFPQRRLNPSISPTDSPDHPFRRDLIRRTIFNCAFFVCLVIPYFAIYTFLPTILKAIYLNDGSGADFLLNGFLVLGALIGIWLTIQLPRRVFLIGSFAVTCLSLVALSLLPESAMIAMIVAFGIFTLTMSAFSNLVGVFPPECFPTEVRACGVGLAIACSRLGSAGHVSVAARHCPTRLSRDDDGARRGTPDRDGGVDRVGAGNEAFDAQ